MTFGAKLIVAGQHAGEFIHSAFRHVLMIATAAA
jgi:hypothetical protein